MKRTFITGLFLVSGLVLSVPVFATDLKVTLHVEGRKFLVGVPITLHATIENVSGRTLYLAYGEKGFSAFPAVQASDHGVLSFCPPQDSKKVEWREGYEIKSLGPSECLKYPGTLCNFTREFPRPGVYKVTWRAQSLGPYERRVGNQVLETYPMAWSGAVESNAVEIEILGPTGIDREALEKIIRPAVQDPRTPPGPNLWQEKVLKDFPTSTYAGYALYAGQPASYILEPISIVEERASYETTAQKWPQTQEQMARDAQRARKANEERIGTLEAYLKARPDFVYADLIRLELAARYAYLERYQDAQCLCDELLKKAPESKEGKKAQQLLTYLQDKGWVEK